MWQPFAANLTVTMLALMAWLVLGEQVARQNAARQQSVFAAAMALSTIASMALSVEPSPGVFFDFRGPLIAVSAFFGGLPAALVVAVTALVCRILLGGTLLVGMLSIVAAAATGLAARRLCRTRRVGLLELGALGAAMALNNFLVPLMMSPAALAIWWPQMWTPITLAAVCTFFVGGIVLFEKRRRELTAANTHYRAMVEALPDCLNIKDAEGRFIAVNEATAQLMRASHASALIGKTDFDFYPADVAASFRADEQRILLSGRHETIEQERRFEDGTQGWLSTLKAPVTDATGRVIALVTHNRDITAAKLMQAKLKETQDYLDQALANMSDGLAIYDAEGKLLFCNKRYQALFPLTGELRVPGAQFDEVMRAALALGEEKLRTDLTEEKHISFNLDMLRTSGESTVELADGRVFSCRTTMLENGCSLRLMSDVTERHRFEKDLEYRALHDPLTGLPNRAFFNRELARLLEKAAAETSDLVVMLIDLDHFKQVNDNFGHPVGDALLVEVSRRLERSVRQSDLVARLGGDEFAVLAYGNIPGRSNAGLASRIMRNLTEPMSVDNISLMPSGTIGYSIYPRDPSDADGLLKNADRALYRAKAERRGSAKAWEPEMSVDPYRTLLTRAG